MLITATYITASTYRPTGNAPDLFHALLGRQKKKGKRPDPPSTSCVPLATRQVACLLTGPGPPAFDADGDGDGGRPHLRDATRGWRVITAPATGARVCGAETGEGQRREPRDPRPACLGFRAIAAVRIAAAVAITCGGAAGSSAGAPRERAGLDA